eukprot:21862_1
MQTTVQIVQGRTGSCLLASLANTISLILRYVHHLIVAPSVIYSALAHIGLRLDTMDTDFLTHIAIKLQLILREYSPVSFNIRFKCIGIPSIDKLKGIQTVVNQHKMHIIGHYQNDKYNKERMTFDTTANNNNNNNNNNSNNNNNANTNNIYTDGIDKIIAEEDDNPDSSHVVSIETITKNLKGQFMFFINDSCGSDFHTSFVQSSLFLNLYVVEIYDMKILRGIETHIYNPINWKDDNRYVIVSPTIYLHSKGEFVFELLASLLYSLPSFDDRYKSLVNIKSCADCQDSKILNVSDIINKYSYLKYNAFVKVSTNVIRTIYLVQMAIKYIIENTNNKNDFKRMERNILELNGFDEDSRKDTFVVWVNHQKLGAISDLCVNEDDLKKIKNVRVIHPPKQSKPQSILTRKLFNEHIFPILYDLHILERVPIDKKLHKYTLNQNLINKGNKFIDDLKEIKHIIHGFDNDIDLLIKNISKYNKNKTKIDCDNDTSDDEEKLIEMEGKELKIIYQTLTIPNISTINVVSTTKPSDHLENLLVNKKFIGWKKKNKNKNKNENENENKNKKK